MYLLDNGQLRLLKRLLVYTFLKSKKISVFKISHEKKKKEKLLSFINKEFFYFFSYCHVFQIKKSILKSFFRKLLPI